MKNAKRALLLSLALLMIALPALAAGKLQTDQENLWEVKTDWSHDAFLFAKVTNVGDRDISISSGVFEAYDAEGQPIASDDYAEAYVKCLKPGEYTYVCIRVKHRLHKGQRAQSRERWRFAKQIQPDLDCGKKEVQWEGAVRQALPNGLGYFYRGTPAGFTT